MTERMKETYGAVNLCNSLNAVAGLARFSDPKLAELLLQAQIKIMELLEETGRTGELQAWYEKDKPASRVILSVLDQQPSHQ